MIQPTFQANPVFSGFYCTLRTRLPGLAGTQNGDPLNRQLYERKQSILFIFFEISPSRAG
jgi:hypothetical protein